MRTNFRLICGSASKELGQEIAKKLKVDVTPVDFRKFSDGELYCRVLQSVRGCDVYIVHSTGPDVNEHLMELLIMADALKRSSPYHITAVIPYYGYCRQDKKHKSREPITAKLVANMIQSSGISRVMTFDLHAPPVQGFFDIPSDNLEAMPLFAQYFLNKKLRDVVVVSPDAGGTIRARAMANELGVPLAIVDKRRPRQNVAQVMNVIGDVKGKTAILIDDIIDTGGSLAAAAKILIRKGAREVYACATHGIFSANAFDKLGKSQLKEVVVTNTIEHKSIKKSSRVKVLSLSTLLAEGIRRTHEGKPMGVVYEKMYKDIQKKASRLHRK